MKQLLSLGLILLLFGSCANINKNRPLITLPLQFHVVSDLTMTKGDLVMENWVTDADIEDIILPEINRIWSPARISFTIDSINEVKSLSPENKIEILDYIVQAHRDKSGKSDPERIRKLNQLIDWSVHSETAINIYLVPYMGETSQGNARSKIKRIFVAEYSDKSSRAKRPPQKVKLTEPRPFEIGSLSRTLAHEIGHILGLKHPDKKTQGETGLLMGGRKQGYALRESDETKALNAAQELMALSG